jgi:6,7-dimethyl-8-ribityllumazine synthase
MSTKSHIAPYDRAAVKGARVLIIEARFNEDIADAELAGAKRELEAANVAYDVISVPGALEIPAAIVFALESAQRYDGFVALGCVIRGETTHYDIVAGESARALMDLSVARAIALGNGILTVENDAQAWDRADPERLDKGGGAAAACLAMIALKKRFDVA